MKMFNVRDVLDKIKHTVNPINLGMILVHNGVVRGTSKLDNTKVIGMILSYDRDKLQQLIDETQSKPGIAYVSVWINEGKLKIGDDIMYVIVAGDRRSNILEPFEQLIESVKNYVVKEREY